MLHQRGARRQRGTERDRDALRLDRGRDFGQAHQPAIGLALPLAIADSGPRRCAVPEAKPAEPSHPDTSEDPERVESAFSNVSGSRPL